MRRDISLFFKGRKWKWVLGLFLQIYMVGGVYSALNLQKFRTGFTDLLVCSFMGKREYIPGQMEPFELPVLWITYHAYLMYLVCDFLTESMEGYGLMELVRSKSRGRWYVRHWAVCAVAAVCYGVQYLLLCAITAFAWGNQAWDACYETVWNAEGVLTLILLPAAAALAMVSIQCVMELLAVPFAACFGSACILVCSTYWKHALLPGNYAMFIRSRMYAQEDGLIAETGAICCLVYIVVSLAVGIYVMERRDIFGKGIEEKWK